MQNTAALRKLDWRGIWPKSDAEKKKGLRCEIDWQHPGKPHWLERAIATRDAGTGTSCGGGKKRRTASRRDLELAGSTAIEAAETIGERLEKEAEVALWVRSCPKWPSPLIEITEDSNGLQRPDRTVRVDLELSILHY
ncbi:hypothetical protein IAQ61_008232 [Plenodomus lingam]|uniref:uncharacterized protein n=1 Tax=Leptosphaeria maculans TaxID=5022 RepID=UPI00331C5E96|nr:hypothetical protein IAQ61_008232 [Plenodomus lingam]